MAIYEFKSDRIAKLSETSFAEAGLRERTDLQRLLRENIDVIAPDTLVIAEEFGDWEDSRRRIDLLAVDKDANIVVIELKRTDDGGHMDLQAIRYASMVSTITFEQAATIYARHLEQIGGDGQTARADLLEFLGGDETGIDEFAQDVRIVLASAEFSKEITTSVLWLNDHGTDIRCVRLKPYFLDDRLLVDVQQLIPTPEAADYQVQIQEKSRRERQARVSNADFTRFDLQIGSERFTSMWKRNAIFKICKRLCDSGIKPSELSALFSWRSNRLWFVVDGELDSDQFETAASAMASARGASFHANRWFCEENELVRSDGKTFAMSNQWGEPNWGRAMTLLKQRYPDLQIEFHPTAGA